MSSAAQAGLRAVKLIGAAVVALMLFASAASASVPQPSCTTVPSIPVALGPGQPQSYTVAGELCATPSELSSGETVQLLIHGASYNHTYWDFGTIDGVPYSYARDLALAGYPTFAIDEIGTGQSSHPPSSDVTIQSAAYVAHEIVQDLLSGAIGNTAFGKVIEVGHSFGSITTWEEAATYHDVAGAIITGGVHDTTVFEDNAIPDLYPAIDDPRFANSGFDPGYLTTVPGVRSTLFDNTADTDPNVIAQDEATKDVISASEFGTGIPLETSTISQQINVPVLLVVGEHDMLSCGLEANGSTFSCSSGSQVASEEAPWYSSAAQMRACVVPNSGHDLNLALNHVVEEADAVAWSYEYVGQQGVPPISSRVLPPDCSS
jgi:pimeloyl-ACP methyl ester carboxylesterase